MRRSTTKTIILAVLLGFIAAAAGVGVRLYTAWNSKGETLIDAAKKSAENSASYEQSATGVGVLAEVEHRIAFGIALRDDAVTLIERLGEASRRGGLAAVVELNTGLELLVGFSSRLGGEQPLLLTGCTVETNAERNKRPSIRVVLSCRDGQWSAICCGSLSNV